MLSSVDLINCTLRRTPIHWSLSNIIFFQWTGSGLVGCPGATVAPPVTMEQGPGQGPVPTHPQLRVANRVLVVVLKWLSVIYDRVQVSS